MQSVEKNIPEFNLTSRNFGIDVMRGIAILFVVIHHMALPFRLPLAKSGLGEWLSRRWTNALSFNGYEAVFIFFVLSGFLIARRAMQQFGALEHIQWRVFYLQRASRIVPLLLVLLAVLCVLHGLGVPGFVIDGPGQSLAGALFSALGLHLNWYEGHTDWLPASWDVLWSLSIEEVFYLAFPALCLLLPRWLLVLGLMVLALSLPITRAALAENAIWQEKAYLPGMSAIAFGVLTAMLSQRGQHGRAFAWCLLGTGALGIFAVFVCGGELWLGLGNDSMLLLCASAAQCTYACAALRFTPPRAWLWRGWSWLADMGRLSYEIYLTHMFIVLPATALFLPLFDGAHAWAFLVYPPTVFACVWLGKACERWISQPSARWLLRVAGMRMQPA
jgi:peptidoglycan/LPS O-acetylase OafA/YrhL